MTITVATSLPQHVPTKLRLSDLVLEGDNIRTTYDPQAMDELKASIASLGILSSLLVIRSQQDGKFAVIAGRRRHQALCDLYGDRADDIIVPCIVCETTDPLEISLAENVIREQMHPADQFIAFKTLIDKGRDIAEIAADFAVSERVVKGRLRLANVSPTIFNAYREGKLTLKQVEAFAIVEFHDDQDQLYNSRKDWIDSYNNGPSEIRKLLIKKTIRGDDKRVKFVGIEAYEAAGGSLYRDLFTDGDENVLIYDVKLLDKLAKEKLDQTAEQLKAEGWSWVDTQTKPLTHAQANKFKNRKPETVPLTEEDQAQIDRLEEQKEKMVEEKADDYGELSEADAVIYDDLDRQVDAIEAKQTVWNDKAKKASGVIVSIDQNGKLEVRQGLIKPSEKAKAAAKEEPEASVKEAKKPDQAWLKIVNGLIAEKLVAIAAGLAHNPTAGLAFLAHGMALAVFDDGEWEDDSDDLSCVSNGSSHSDVMTYLDDAEEGQSLAADTLMRLKAQWKEKLPQDQKDWLLWFLGQESETLTQMLAFLTAMGLQDRFNTWRGYDPVTDNGPSHPLNVLGRYVGTDMKSFYKPTRENYFDKVGKDQLLADMAEAAGGKHAEGREKLKETDLADLAARELPDAGWLPEPVRITCAPITPIADEENTAKKPKAAKKAA